MSETLTVTPKDFSKAMKELIKVYGDEAFNIVKKEAISSAREGSSELKRSAPTGGRYARGWSHKALRRDVLSYTEIIYNRTDYQLTHLLEKGHKAGKTGWYPTHIDYTGTIKRVEDKFGARFYEGVVEKL